VQAGELVLARQQSERRMGEAVHGRERVAGRPCPDERTAPPREPPAGERVARCVLDRGACRGRRRRACEVRPQHRVERVAQRAGGAQRGRACRHADAGQADAAGERHEIAGVREHVVLRRRPDLTVDGVHEVERRVTAVEPHRGRGRRSDH
jgi:hypothetical protein